MPPSLWLIPRRLRMSLSSPRPFKHLHSFYPAPIMGPSEDDFARLARAVSFNEAPPSASVRKLNYRSITIPACCLWLLYNQETHSIPGRSTRTGLQYKVDFGNNTRRPLMRTRTRKRILKKLGPHHKRANTPAREQRTPKCGQCYNPAFTEVFLNFKRKPGSQQGTRVSLVTQFQLGRASLNPCYFSVGMVQHIFIVSPSAVSQATIYWSQAIYMFKTVI